MSEVKELVAVPPAETALSVYTTPNGLEPWLQQVRVKVDEFKKVLPDLKTKKGRDSYASMAHRIAKSKTALEDVGKKLSAEQKELPKKIDAERKRVWDMLELWQKEVRQPLTDWEKANDARIDAHNDRLEWLRALPLDLASSNSLHVQGLIAEAEGVAVGPHWEEFEIEAGRAKELALNTLRAILAELQRYEAEQAELLRLRAEAEARTKADREAAIAREAVDRERQAAEQRAQAERDAATQREQALIDAAAKEKRDAEQARLDAQAAAERQALQLQLQQEQAARAAEQAERNRVAAEQQAEQDRLAAIKRQADAVEAAKQAEIRRQAAEKAEEQRLAAEREADKVHKGKVNSAALAAFIAAGMPEACAKQAVTLIAQRKIPAVAITY